MTITSGGDVLLHYLWEDNGYASSPNDSTHKTFGREPRLTTSDINNNPQEIFGPNSKVPTDILEQLFDGQAAVQFTYNNPWWAKGVFGAPSTTDNGDGSYTHTYTVGTPVSMQLVETYLGAGKDRLLQGWLPTQIEFNFQVGQNAQVTVRGPYAKEDTQTTSLSSQTTYSYDPMNFAQAEARKAGSNISKVVQSMSLTLSHNVTLIPGLGSRFPVDFSDKELTSRVNIRKVQEANIDHLKAAYGGNTSTQETIENTARMNAVLDNGATGGSINKADLEVTAGFPADYSPQNTNDPTADVEETFTRWGKDVTLTADNSTATAP